MASSNPVAKNPDAGPEHRKIKLSELEFTPTRDVRDHIVEEIAERIKKEGYNEAFAFSVIDNNGRFEIADGNHRAKALEKVGFEGEVPCLVYEDSDVYEIAVRANRAANTLAVDDLFDWLRRVRELKEDCTQEEIAEKFGWSRQKVSQYAILLNEVATQSLEIAKKHEEGRVAENATSVTTFSEGWFRKSGIYELNAEYQEKLMRWYCEEKNCEPATQTVQKKAEELKEVQEQVKLVEEEMPEIEEKEKRREELIESVKNREYTTERLEETLDKLKERAKNLYRFGVDSREELEKLDENSIDCVVTDPPWGIEFENVRETENPDFDKSFDEIKGLLEEVFSKVSKVAKANAHIYVFFPMENFEKFRTVLGKYFEVHHTPLIWVKNNHNPCDYEKRPAQIYEPLFFCWNDNKGRKFNHDVFPTAFEFEKVRGEEKYHQAQKPVKLLEHLIANSTGYEETVLDPFAGSGSVLLAAAKNDRHFIGFEKDDTYEGEFKRKLREVKK